MASASEDSHPLLAHASASGAASCGGEPSGDPGKRSKVVKVSILRKVLAGCQTPVFKRRFLYKRPEQEAERERRCLSIILGLRDPSEDPPSETSDSPQETGEELSADLEVVVSRDSLDLEFASVVERDRWYTALCWLSRHLASPAERALQDAEAQLEETRQEMKKCRERIAAVSGMASPVEIFRT